MKKIFTLTLLAAAALSARAETLWEGSCSFTNWNPVEGDERPVLSSSDFASAVVGDRLVLTISEYGDDSWREAQIYTWNGSGTGELVVGSGSIAGLSSCTFTLDATILSTLQSTDVCIIGTGYTVTTIELEAPEQKDDNLLWSGTMTVNSWDNTVTLGSDTFGNLEAGDSFAFTVTAGNADSSIAVRSNPDWGDVPTDSSDYINITNGPGIYYWEINADAAEEINKNGVVITGTDYTLTKIELIPKGVESRVKTIMTDADAPVYNLNGMKVADRLEDVTFPGIYISGGKKFIVR